MRFKMLGSWCLALGLLAAVAEEPKVQTRVTVTSQPDGALVSVDGVDRGTTPLTLYDLAPGRHHLKYRMPGYGDCDRFFNTSEGPYVEKHAVLEELKGLLLVKTEPSGCDIQVDGISIGMTPRLVTTLALKDAYDVRLRKAGYLDKTIRVKFDGRRPLVCEEQMVLASGTIAISSEPAGADVTVNGVQRGKTPLTVSGVPKGRAVVRFHLDGFIDETRELTVNAGDEQALPIVLKGLPGTLRLTSVPDGARFYVNGEARGKGPLALPGLASGDYEVRAELDGHAPLTKTLHLANGASVGEEFRLSNIMGRLEVRTSPVGAQVLVDGRLVGTTQSKDPDAEFSDILAIENLAEGEHTLVLKMEGYADKTCHPKIENSKTSKYHRQRLTRIFIPDVEIVTVRTTCKGILLSVKPDYVEIESSPGIKRTFPRNEVRDIRQLKKEP